MLNYIATGPGAYEVFKKALRETCQEFIVDKLESTDVREWHSM